MAYLVSISFIVQDEADPPTESGAVLEAMEHLQHWLQTDPDNLIVEVSPYEDGAAGNGVEWTVGQARNDRN